MAVSNEDSNFLSDTFHSAKELITERFSSPFIFSYLVSWMAIHYEVVILAFTDSSSDLKIYDKLDLIQTHINNTYFSLPFLDSIQLNGFTWALIAACFYTFAYPFLDYLITKFTLERKVAIRNLRVIAENSLVFSADDVKRIYKIHAETEEGLNSRIKNFETNENQLKLQIDALQNQIKLEKESQLEQEATLKNSIKTKLVNVKPITKKAKLEQSEKADISEKNYVLKTYSEIENAINGLQKDELLAITTVGRIQEQNKFGLEDDGLSLTMYNIPKTLMNKRPDIFKIKTNPKTLNKIYVLSDYGNQIYGYLSNESQKP